MKWVLAHHDAGAASRLSDEAGIHPLIARLMVGRGITDAAAARTFLSADLSTLTAPGVLAGMDRAVRRIRAAVAGRERLVVYGDYDVDGVTGAAVLYLALRDLGADVGFHIPDRMTEGYGLHSASLRRIREQGARVVITVDCGITAVREAAAARDLGIDLIITDHHETAAVSGGQADADPAALPEAFAVLHPRLASPGLPDAVRENISGLTGVGVAFKLVQGLLDDVRDDPRLATNLDLVALGTVADMGRITGENRVLVRQGLGLLSSEPAKLRPGIAALKRVAGIPDRRVTVGTVSFSLAPRINASGRLARADTAFRLLTTVSADEASGLAAELDAVNRDRQAREEAIWSEARERCLREDLSGTGAFVLESGVWHPGVIGIVASRIVDEFYRPTALISVRDGIGKGSARSIPGFDLYAGLLRCADLLAGFGGHKYAAGFTIAEDRIPLFRERLSAVVLEHAGAAGFVRTVTIDAPVNFDDITLDLLRGLEQMAPFGQGNPEPRLGARGLEVASVRMVGSGNKHLKMRLRQPNGRSFDAIAYNQGEQLGSRLRGGDRVAAVFVPRITQWNGSTGIELEIKDVKPDRQ
jgi:single-stranded-DNA-specific exonuclease